MLQEGIIKERAKDVEYIEKQYTKTIKEIDDKIRSWYQRLADNNGVSYAEAQKLLSKNELDDFKMTVEEYIEKGLSGGFEKELENASARVHISRLEALEMELQAHAEELTGKRIARTESAISDAYTESYYHTGYEVQQMAGVGVNMRKVDKKRLENVLARPWAADDKTFTARCWTDKNKLVNILEGELTRMVATGAAPDKAIKNIADAFNTSKANARRLVLTESAVMASVAEQDCYKELDVEEYEIVGTFDTKMCEDCASWHGQHFPRKDFKIGVNAPPFHPNCYCVTVPYFDDMAGIGERWMRNPETGKGEWIPSDMSYRDWKDIYVDKKYTLDDWKAKHTPKQEATVPVTGRDRASYLRKVDFTPAQSIEEAQEYAKRFVVEKTWSGNGNVSFKGLSVESANKINETLAELYETYDLPQLYNIQPMNFRANIWKDSLDAPMAYRNMQSGELYFNPKILKNAKTVDGYFKRGEEAFDICRKNIDKFTGEKRKLVETYIKAGRQNVADDAKDKIKAFAQHEMGHHIQNQILWRNKEAVANMNAGIEEYAVKISGYATSTRGEYIAESFCAFCNDEASRIDPFMKSYFEGLLK